ncbi:MAG: hypothetical protein HYR60_16430 [Acidobacteria bacterium]|nr:hypothetical protein [Acidobacteriota bacterium]MBI3470020.1 hypothetical protein [Candidatus Solibacter usitatus]
MSRVRKEVTSRKGNRSTPTASVPAAVLPGQKLRAVALRLLADQSRDRTRMARILHDEVAQLLSGAGLQLDLLRMDLEARVPEIAPRTAEIQAILEEIVVRIRELSYDLNPEIVERAGLYAALDRLVGRRRQDFPGKIRLLYDSSVRIPTSAAVPVYKIAEQALDNAVRHCGGGTIDIRMRRSPLGPTLEVRDSGLGFDVHAVLEEPCGIGLVSMDQFARQSGLTLSVSSRTGKGTVVKVVAPSETT